MKQEKTEVKASDISECKDHFGCGSIAGDDIKNDLEDAKKYFVEQLLMDIDLKYNLRFKMKMLRSFKNYQKNYGYA